MVLPVLIASSTLGLTLVASILGKSGSINSSEIDTNTINSDAKSTVEFLLCDNYCVRYE